MKDRFMKIIDRKITVEDLTAILWVFIVTVSFILFFEYDFISRSR